MTMPLAAYTSWGIFQDVVAQAALYVGGDFLFQLPWASPPFLNCIKWELYYRKTGEFMQETSCEQSANKNRPSPSVLHSAGEGRSFNVF